MLTALTLLASVAAADPVTVDGHPVNLEPTPPWTAAVRGKHALTLARKDAYVELAVQWTPGLQHDLSVVALDDWVAALSTSDSLPAHIDFGAFTGRRLEHPTLGTVLVVASQGTVQTAPDPVQMRFAAFTGPAGTVSVVGGIFQPPDRADALLDEALDQLTWKRPPYPPDAFPTGHVTPAGGYALDLPDGWRGLHEAERDVLDLKPSQAVFLDPRVDPPLELGCVTNTGPLDVVDPTRSALHGRNYRTRTRALLAGGSFVARSGSTRTRTQVTLDRTPVRIAPDAEGTLEWIELGERHAYLWTVPATVEDQPVEVRTVYTTWDTRTVDCTWVAEPEHPASAAVDAALRSVRVVDGQAHPQPLSGAGWYVSTWPFTHPLLQVWWFGAVLILLAVVVLLRQLR